MLESLLLGVFSVALLACVLTDTSILFALTFGLALFSGYALQKGNTPREVLQMWWRGVHTIVPILVTFVLIGMITAFWRAGGTIPAIVSYGAAFASPSVMVLATFLLCALMSVLTGTAFGTGATMGVICMTMARGLGLSELSQLFVGGAIVAGSYYGDRMSPMSTSALLVATLTHTDIYQNLKGMFRTGLVPTILACIIYLALGFIETGNTNLQPSFYVATETATAITNLQPPSPRGEGHEVAGGVAQTELATSTAELAGNDITTLFAQSFDLSFITLIPAVLIVILSILRWHVQRMMAASIAAAIVIAVIVQDIALADLPHIAVFGYHPADPALAAAIGGGGILSMGRVSAIVGLSSCYAGLFEATGFLHAFTERIAKLSAHITPFGSVLVAGILTSMVACNQTLSILLTHDLCKDVVKDKAELALGIENTAVILSPVIPWSIAAAVPLAATGAEASCLAFAVYLYLLPLWNLGVAMREQRQK